MDKTTSKTSAPPKPFKTVSKYYRKYKAYLIWGMVATVISNALLLYTPKVLKRIIDAIEQGREMSFVGQLILLLIGLTVLSGAFRFMMRRTIIWMSRWLEFDLRGELFGHLLKLSPTFYHNNRTGDVMARMTNDLEAVRQMSGPGIMYLANAITSLIIGIPLMISTSLELTLLSIAPMIVLPFSVNRIGNLLHIRQAKIQEHFGDITAAAQENLAGMRVVKAYTQEEPEIKNFRILSHKYIGLNMDLAKVQGLFMPLMRLLAGGSILIVLFVGGRMAINGTQSIGTLVEFFGYVSLLTWPVIAVGWVVSLYQRGRASLTRINKVLHTEPAVKDKPDAAVPATINGRIEFRNLRFSYNGQPVLEDIDVTIEPGQTIGLLGLTGSGKTTLVNLVARLHPVERGMIFIDGKDINDWPVYELRKRIGFATQEPFLFSDTIAENVRFGNRNADLDQVRKAGRIADLDKDVEEFPNAYDTMVGERGITLSGGQKQRTAIARAILVDPTILILDDATSAVDTETEHEINMRIKEVLAGRTSIIISHRVSSVKDADMVLCLQDGRIIERGTHETLMSENGFYADLYRSQLLEKELEEL